MKNVFNWLLAAVCLFTVGNVQVMASNEAILKSSVKIMKGGSLIIYNGALW